MDWCVFNPNELKTNDNNNFSTVVPKVLNITPKTAINTSLWQRRHLSSYYWHSLRSYCIRITYMKTPNVTETVEGKDAAG